MAIDSLQQSPSKGRILVCAADPEECQRAETLLVAQGYLVSVCASWVEARVLLHRDRFDLLLSDLQAGGGRGAEVARIFSASEAIPDYFVFIAPDQIAQGRAALCGGAGGYLFSPFDADELLLLIDRTLYRAEEGRTHARLRQEVIELRSGRDALDKCFVFLTVFDLDRLGDLVLDTLMELCGAESGTLWLAGSAQSELRLRARRGLALVGAVSPELHTEAPELTYLLRDAPSCSAEQNRLYIPLRRNGTVVGLICLESPAGKEGFTAEDLLRAASAAIFAAATLQALLRQKQTEHDLLRVPGSQAYNMTFFRDHLEKELFAANRYDRQLSVIKLVVDNYAELTSRFHTRKVAVALEALVATVMTVLRDADIISEIIPGKYYILLPETDPWGALMAQRRMRKALGSLLTLSDLKKNLPIRVRMRAASSPADGTTLNELDHLIENRLDRLRRSLLLRGSLEQAPFWTVTDQLLADERLPPLSGELPGGAFFTLPAGGVPTFCAAVCHEILTETQVRGVIHWGCNDFAAAGEALGAVAVPHDTRTTVCLLGDPAGGGADAPGWVTIPLHDDPLTDHAFLLCLGEDYAYALLARQDACGWRAFHSDDFFFVENMLAKLQEQYQLQTQI